jgi:riboflavin synthase
MFTGLIQEVGVVHTVQPAGGKVQLRVEAPVTAPGLAVNDSIAIDGVCQTVVARTDAHFTVEAVEETLRKTTFGDLERGNRVNLEAPLRLGDRLGGHLVLGHVDCTGVVRRIETLEGSWLVHVEFPAEFGRYLIPVGSVGVDGVSLTVARLEGGEFTVSVIPHTLSHTTIGAYREGKRVNLEFDVLGKYVERLLRSPEGMKGGISWEELRKWGYST